MLRSPPPWCLAGLVVLTALSGCVSEGPASDPPPTTSGSGTTSSPSPTPPPTPATSPATTGPQPSTTDGSWDPASWSDGGCTLGVATDPGTRPDIWVHAGGRAHRLAWNGSAYAVAASGPADTAHLSILDARAYTATTEEPFRLLELAESGGALHVAAQVEGPRTTALASDGTHLWAAGGWNLTAYAPGLGVVGRVATPPPHGYVEGKAVDAIAIAGGRAFLVDDVLSPFYGFLVDVADPAGPEVLDTISWSASLSPSWQWVEGDRWWVEGGFSGRGGTSKVAQVFTVGPEGADEAGSVAIWSRSRDLNRGTEGTPKGYEVLAAGSTSPIHAVLRSGNGTWFSSVSLTDNGPVTTCRTPLQADLAAGPGMRTTIAVLPDSLVAVAVGDWLGLWARGGGHHLQVHAQRLPWAPSAIAA